MKMQKHVVLVEIMLVYAICVDGCVKYLDVGNPVCTVI